MSRPFTVSLTNSGLPDGAALPVDVHACFSRTAALSGDDPPTESGAFRYKQILDNGVAGHTGVSYTWAFDPNLQVADVDTIAALLDGFKIKTPQCCGLIFNLNGGGTLNAVTATWTIIQ